MAEARADSPFMGPITCPQCGHHMPSDARVCPHCGVDLVLLALLAERAYLEDLPGTAPLKSTPGVVVPRLGDYLIDQGLIRQEQLDEALLRQKQWAAEGRHRLIGMTLVDMGYLDRETLDRAITRQIIELHAALQETNRTLERRVSERTAELRRALERLTELNQIKANLISNVSHELRTPLAHIKGYIELLSDGQLGPVLPDQAHALSVVERGIARLERLIEDLIAFSTGSRQGLTLNLEKVTLEGLAQDSVARSQAKAGKAGVTLQVSFDADLPEIEVDKEKMSWVLYQLVDNGIKFTPNGGQVTVSGHREDGSLLVAVEDTGIGIPPGRLDEIFEPFHQLDGSPTRRYGGTGLGLSLVKLILQAHGSTMHVRSEEGKGSTFSFTLLTQGPQA
jgi:signal transduction histidine kinase